MSLDWQQQLDCENWYEGWKESEDYLVTLRQFIYDQGDKFFDWFEEQNSITGDAYDWYERYINVAAVKEWGEVVYDIYSASRDNSDFAYDQWKDDQLEEK